MLPGTLVQGLITSVHSSGLNLQLLGFFDGTVDQLHMGKDASAYKIGKKIKARILYDYSSSPPKFALTLMDHALKLGPSLIPANDSAEKGLTVKDAYPVGTVLDSVKVLRVEPERGVIVEVTPGVEGFVHVCPFISIGHNPRC